MQNAPPPPCNATLSAPQSAPATPAVPGGLAARWGFAGEMLEAILNLFGAPADLAAKRLMPRDAWADLCVWVSVLECMVRRLLLISSWSVILPAAPEPAERKTRMRKTPAESGAGGYANPDPERWSVGFSFTHADFGAPDDDAPPLAKAAPNGLPASLLSPEARRMLRALNTPKRLLALADRMRRLRDGDLPLRKGRKNGAAFVSTLPIVARLEALRRVIAAPDVYAMRLARLLRTRSMAVLHQGAKPEILEDFISRALAAPDHRKNDCRWAIDDLKEPALQAGLRFIPSG